MKLYREISNEFSELFDEKVMSAKNVIITAHISPDDDSVSAILSVYYYITEYLKVDSGKVAMYYTGDKSKKWKYFINYKKINYVKDISNYLDKSDLLIVLDGSFWNRFSRDENVSSYKGTTICLDHHYVVEPQFDFHLNIKDVTSTAEIVFRLFFTNKKLDKNICELLLLGILGDTGNFEFVNEKTSNVFAIAEKLVNEGKINIQSFKGLYNKMDLGVYRCLREFMSNGEIISVEGWPEFMFSYVDTEFVNENELTDNQTSEACLGFMPYLRSVGNSDWGFTITPRLHDGTQSLSFRSSPGSVNVREMMEKMQIGGGHDRAAGGKIKTKSVEKAKKTVFDWMKNNKPSFS